MQRRWALYLSVGAALLVYTAMGFIASRTVIIPITLKPGAATELSILRLNPGSLRMNAWFEGRNRKELGGIDFSGLKAGKPASYPSDEVARLEVEFRPSGQEPVRYGAEPASGFTGARTARVLNAISPDGQLPKPRVALKTGMNPLAVAVISVDERLVGETIEIWIDPALGFKSSEPEVSWLWWSIVWPLYGVPYLLWGITLLWLHRSKRGKLSAESA